MDTDTPEATEQRRATVALLLAAGKSLRLIARETGIPLSAVHRAKQQIEKTTAGPECPERAAAPAEPPSSYIVRQTIDGIPHDVRRLTVDLYEHKVSAAVRRGLLHPDKRHDPGTVLSALFASLFDDYTVDWLRRRGWRGDRGQAEAIIDAVNRLIIQLPS